MHHCKDDIGQVMNSAWFSLGMMLGNKAKEFSLAFFIPFTIQARFVSFLKKM